VSGATTTASAGAPRAAAYTHRTTCRGCGGERLHPFLALGPTPLANSLLRDPSEFATEASYPLDVHFCETCSLVQLLDVVDPEVLFRDYIYVTGTSDTIARHNVEYARTVVDLTGATHADLVVEVASNDGSLLSRFAQLGVRALGVEPATNIARLARERGLETVNEFFDRRTAAALRERYGSARAVIGNNVLAHVDDPRDFLAGFRTLLDDRGLAIVEVPYLGELVDRLEYDTVYHEHLCYFSVAALARLYERAGLGIVRIDRVPVHGGSLRVYAASDERVRNHAPEVVAMIAAERAAGLHDLARYRRLAGEVEENRRALRALLAGLRAQGRTIAGYGAPAKGNTLLNYCGITVDELPYTVDRSPLKVGRYTPGTHIPVLTVETLLERQPDYLLILAWNFADEIIAQQDEYRRRGGQFIVPIPTPRVVS
jgi:hypothetical protein